MFFVLNQLYFYFIPPYSILFFVTFLSDNKRTLSPFEFILPLSLSLHPTFWVFHPLCFHKTFLLSLPWRCYLIKTNAMFEVMIRSRLLFPANRLQIVVLLRLFEKRALLAENQWATRYTAICLFSCIVVTMCW